MTRNRVLPGRPYLDNGDRMWKKGLHDYYYIGRLTHSNFRFLAGLLNDSLRKQTLTRWYGTCGALVAWEVWENKRHRYPS